MNSTNNTPISEELNSPDTSANVRKSSLCKANSTCNKSATDVTLKQLFEQRTSDERAHNIAQKMLDNCSFSAHLGIELVDARAHYSVCKMKVESKHTNGHDTCHGGAIFSLADTTFAHLCNANNQVVVGHMCTIAYWQPALIGDELYAYAYESGVYGRSGSYRVEVTRGKNGDILAEFQGFSRALKGKMHF
ncbi:hotdog fold thioesterase [Psychrobacter lutiphocae]|uniref:hotdog fold thioesterase n=1 Tax=Psychrobacter lutiphocae TaxID=540500 RepID=UPI00037C1E7A|nr:hotdog fold thioesterase [Psychrobacter lutiphocae]